MSPGASNGDIVDDIIRREGGEKETNDPSDAGGRTKFGISERSHPEAWADGDVSRQEARAIYEAQYVAPFKGITDQYLLHQLVDFGVPSGPVTSVRILQQILGVTVDGQLGPKTLEAINNYPAGTLFGVPVPGSVLLNFAFRDARMLFYSGIAKRIPVNLKYLLGWQRRAQEFR